MHNKQDERDYSHITSQKEKGKPTMNTDNTKYNEHDYYIIRAHGAGVFFGNIKERIGNEVVIINARRLWYWRGAASLSQLANEGVKNKTDSKFTVTVSEITVLDVIEILKCTDDAVANINGVKEWKV